VLQDGHCCDRPEYLTCGTRRKSTLTARRMPAAPAAPRYKRDLSRR
jgi:hypothetical protein